MPATPEEIWVALNRAISHEGSAPPSHPINPSRPRRNRPNRGLCILRQQRTSNSCPRTCPCRDNTRARINAPIRSPLPIMPVTTQWMTQEEWVEVYSLAREPGTDESNV